MKAFFCEEQMLHQPQQFMRLGRLCAPTDTPARAQALHAVLAARGVPVQAPPDYGRGPLHGVHSPDYLDFLEHAHTRWLALRANGMDPGDEVLPNLGPYYSGRLEQRSAERRVGKACVRTCRSRASPVL